MSRFDVEENLKFAEIVEESKRFQTTETHSEVFANVVETGSDVATANSENSIKNIINVRRYNSLTKLIMTSGYILRFTNNLLNRIQNNYAGVIKEDELRHDEGTLNKSRTKKNR